MSAIIIDDRGDGIEMVVTRRLASADLAALRSGIVEKLVLNYALGYVEDSLDFLADAQSVRDLTILDPSVTVLDPIYAIANLEKLQVTTNPDLGLDLARFPKLREISASWSQVAETIEACIHLQVARFRKYEPANLKPLSQLAKLSTLILKDGPRLSSLDELDGFSNMSHLGVFQASRLDHLPSGDFFESLRRLEVEACRAITDLAPLARFRNLRFLNISELQDVDSLEFLNELKDVSVLLAYGSTKVTNGDLGPVMELGHLADFRMQSRRHYVPSVETIRARLQLV